MSGGQWPAILEHLRRWAAPEAASLSDAELLARFVTERASDAFAALMQRHGRMVWSVCRNVLGQEQDAEDAFQATFLVLARKAASIRKGTALASWLHGTAYHIAWRARRDSITRRKHERKGANMPRAEVAAESSWREVQAILDEEIQKLSARQRAVFVLCALEGKRLAEVAGQLGWKEGTVSGTLSRAREQLRRRLARRGVELSAVLAGLALATAPASAVSAALVEGTLHAALALASGGPTAGVISASVASLLRQATQMFAVTKLRLVVFTLAASVITTAVAGFAWQRPEDKLESVTEGAAREADLPRAERDVRARTDRFGDPLPPRAVARIGTVRWWCGKSHGPLAFAPDGKSLALCENRGVVRFLDTTTGKELQRIAIPDGGGWSCFALASNGKMVATARLRSSVIRIWDVRTGKELRQIEGDPDGTGVLAFSPDGKHFAAGMEDTTIRLWDTAAWKEIRRFTAESMANSDSLVFLADGKTLVSGDGASIRWWDMTTGKEVRRIYQKRNRPEDGFCHLAASPDGKRLAANRSHNVLFLWDAVTGKEINRVVLETNQVDWNPEFYASCLCFSPDSQVLVCGDRRAGWGNQTQFFAAATGEKLRRWDEGNNFTVQLAFSPDGKVLAQVQSGVIRLRNAQTGKPLMPVLGLPDYVTAVRFSRDAKVLIASCCGGRIGSWNPLTGEPLTPLHDLPEGFGRRTDVLLGTALTAHGERAALANLQGVLHVWEPATGKACCRIGEPPIDKDQADFSPDGKMVAVGHQDDRLRLWDATTGKLLRSLQKTGDQRYRHPHVFSPDGRILAVAPPSLDNRIIYLYETRTAKEADRFTWHDPTMPTCLTFSPDGQYLLAAHEERPLTEGHPGNSLRLWDVASKRELRRIPVRTGNIPAMAISPDGKTLAAADVATILLFEQASGKERGRFTGHREWIWSLAFSPDGRLLASGSLDYTACVWDVTGICPNGKWSSRRVKSGEIERLWAELGDKDGMRAYRALWRLVAAGPSVVAFLAQHLRPVPRVEEERLTRLLADLDSDQFEPRNRASQELRRLGERAEPALRKALAAKPSLEMARRLRALLEQVEIRTLSTEQLRALRAVEVLEHIGSGEARTVLRSLAAGALEDGLTREAKASLQRLAGRTVVEP